MSPIALSIKDYLSGKFLGLSLAPLMIPMVLFGLFLVLGGGELLEVLETGASSGDFSFLDEKAHPVLAFLLGLAVVKWLLVTFFYLFGGLFAVLLSIVLAIVVIGFLTPVVVKIIRKRHYAHINLEGMKASQSLSMTLGVFGRFALLLLVMIPFMFIPVLNIVAINLPFFYLFHRMLVLDVASTMMSKERFFAFKDSHRFSLLLINGGFFFLSLIPLVGLFLQLLFVTYLSHYMFQKEIIPSIKTY